MEVKRAISVAKIIEPAFKQNKDLGNVIGFYIFDYNPEYKLLVRDKVSFIKRKAKGAYGLNIIEFDLYDIIFRNSIFKGIF